MRELVDYFSTYDEYSQQMKDMVVNTLNQKMVDALEGIHGEILSNPYVINKENECGSLTDFND